MTQRHSSNWLRAEHEIIDGLSVRLEQMAGVVPRTNEQSWIRETNEHFDRFRAHLIRHMAEEETGGFLEPVVERRPALSREVDGLAHEHREMIRIMEGIGQTLHSLEPDDRLLIRDCCARILKLLSYVSHHQHRESLLVLSVFTDDIGAGD